MQGSHARPWRFALEGDALVPVVDRRESLPVETQGASYRAARPGTGRIVGTQIACPAPRPGEVACMAVEQAWAVTVVVR